MNILKTKFSKLLLLLLVLTATLAKQSCKKIDQNKNEVTEEETFAKFFKGEETANSLTKIVIEEIKKKQKENPNYIPSIIQKNGYPIWDKSKTKLPKITNARNASENAGREGSGLYPERQRVLGGELPDYPLCRRYAGSLAPRSS